MSLVPSPAMDRWERALFGLSVALEATVIIDKLVKSADAGNIPDKEIVERARDFIKNPDKIFKNLDYFERQALTAAIKRHNPPPDVVLRKLLDRRLPRKSREALIMRALRFFSGMSSWGNWQCRPQI